jgi:protease-4
MGGMAASGGYYVSMAVGDVENTIFAEPTSITGSIGVIIPHYDVSELMTRFGVKEDSIVTHPRKQMLSMTKALPDEHRDLLQKHVDSTLERFIEVVKMGRPKLRDGEGLVSGEINLATGEIFTSQKAKEFGLIDSIGFIEDAIERVCELQGLSSDEVRVVRYSPPPSLFSLSAMQASQSAPGPTDLLQILGNSSPRAYFVCSSLPPLITSASYGE